MGQPAKTKTRATYQDVLDAPRHMVDEVLAGELHLQSRPRLRHAKVSSRLGGRLDGFDDDGIDGPGGWTILFEPEIHFGAHDPDIVVPDRAGWRRERLPEVPDEAFITVSRDWACEVLSPSTEHIDRADKVPIYAREGVRWVWLLDPDVRTLEVFRLDADDGAYRVIGTWRDDAEVRAEPFDAIALPLSALWSPPTPVRARQKRKPPASRDTGGSEWVM